MNAATEEKLFSGRVSGTSETTTTTHFNPSHVEQFKTGSYYYTIYAIDDDKNQIGPEARSETKAFTCSNERAPAPVNLRWTGKSFQFDLPASYKSKVNRLQYELYYSEMEDGPYTRKASVSSSMKYEIDLTNRMATPGFYKCSVQVYNTDPGIILPSLKAELPVILVPN